MSIIGLSRAASASVEEKIYGWQVSLSVYLGMARATIENAFPIITRIPFASLLGAFVFVFTIQSIIFVIALATKIFSVVWVLPALFGGVLAYVPIVNKWV